MTYALYKITQNYTKLHKITQNYTKLHKITQNYTIILSNIIIFYIL